AAFREVVERRTIKESLQVMLSTDRDIREMVSLGCNPPPTELNRVSIKNPRPSFPVMAKFRTAADLLHSPIEWATPVTTLGQAARIMKDNWFSQLPVRDGEKSVGRVTEDMLCRELKARSRDTVHHMLVEDLPKQGKPFR